MNGPSRAPNAASVRARLAALARKRNVEVQLVLSEFAVERFLYRLGVSQHADRFVLKGATLLRHWSGDRGRATWDLDLLGYGPSEVAEVVTVVQELCGIPADDGIEFLAESARGEEIREPDEYAGVRVRLVARLAAARIPVQVDVGFGDAVSPPPTREQFPPLLDHEPPRVLVYPREAVVAEKVEAMVSLGLTNSRMKDFYDVYRLAATSEFEGATLARTIRATFERRRTPIPEGEPLVLTPGFLGAPERQTQWRAFLRRGRLEASPDASELAAALRWFLLPVLAAIASNGHFDARWKPGGPWRPMTEGGPS